MTRRVLVTGSRTLTDMKPVFEALDYQLQQVNQARRRSDGSYSYMYDGVIVVHGDCPKGADNFARQWCAMYAEYCIEERHPADWDTHGKAAGAIRNKQMVDLGADVCLAFPRGEARGTMHCVREAEKAGIPIVYG